MPEPTAMTPKGRTEATTPEATRGGAFFSPRVDIFETPTELTLCADIPGVRPEDVDLRYENGELLLTGRIQPHSKTGTELLSENEVGDFYRAFAIHESIDSTGISAECKNGVLTVHLPKVKSVQPKQIRVKA